MSASTSHRLHITRIMRFWGTFIAASIIGRKLVFTRELLDLMSSSHTHTFWLISDDEKRVSGVANVAKKRLTPRSEIYYTAGTWVGWKIGTSAAAHDDYFL